MAIHHPTPPISGGERPRLPSTQVGPVTQAIRAMRAADLVLGPRQFTHGIRAPSPTELEDLIGGLIDLPDPMDGDGDREPEVLDGSAVECTGLGLYRCNEVE
ncbi:hypothetical protein MKK75_12900, partial [Methylobacterium sp. J-030]|nr:hypothetical protein [Methylobacterium sp. J-030]